MDAAHVLLQPLINVGALLLGIFLGNVLSWFRELRRDRAEFRRRLNDLDSRVFDLELTARYSRPIP